MMKPKPGFYRFFILGLPPVILTFSVFPKLLILLRSFFLSGWVRDCRSICLGAETSLMTQKEPQNTSASCSFLSVLWSEGCHREQLYPRGSSLWSAGRLLLWAALAPHSVASPMVGTGNALRRIAPG